MAENDAHDDKLSQFVDENQRQDALREAAENTINKVNDSEAPVCSQCGELASRICSHCGQDFCSKHLCITHELGSERIPLTDEDGVTHQGRRIRLIGEGWPTELAMINNMSDEELETHIRGLQELLKRAIETTDYALVSIARAEYVRDYKRHSRYVAAIKRREKFEKQGALRLNGKKYRASGAKVPDDIAALMKLFGINQEQAIALKASLGKAKT